MSSKTKILYPAIAFLFAISGLASADTLFVSPDGSGDYPNIQAAIDNAQTGDMVFLTSGVYSGRGNRDISLLGKAIMVRSQSGNATDVVLDVEGEDGNMISERGFLLNSGEGTESVISDLTIINGSADAPCPDCDGGGIYVDHSSPSVINVIFRDNNAGSGGGLASVGGSPIIEDCKFIENHAFDGAGAYFFDGAAGTVDHCLFYGNHADLRGAGVSSLQNASVIVMNCTISNNDAEFGGGIGIYDSDFEIKNAIISFSGAGEAVYFYGESTINISYSDLYGNSGGDWTGEIADQYGVNGNISDDPEYVDTVSADFYLTENSPCIDTGDPDSPFDPDTTRCDIGAYFFDHSAGIGDETGLLPATFNLYQNYPNPFNPTTTIDYDLAAKSQVRLIVYDLLGRQTATLVNEINEAGAYSVTWQAGVPSGVYFYRMSVDGYTIGRKMILLK